MSQVAGDPVPDDALGRAKLERSRGFPVIWLIPIVAIGVGAWLAWDAYSKRGPTISVTFDGAEGLQAGESQLKYKDLTLGTVKSLSLTADRSHVVAIVETTREAEPLLNRDTRFWVVRPRLFAGTLSGLGTLLSGSYIGMIPGEQGTSAQRSYIGLEDPPVLTTAVPGRIFLVRAKRLGAVTLGSPVYFRDLEAGQVLGYDIGDMAEYVTIHVFVRAPFDKYVHDNTRFWNASGLSVKLGAQGVDVQFDSLRALLLGGVAFDTPDADANSPASPTDHEFPLFASADLARDASYTRKVEFVSSFTGSVRGLAPGAEVVFRGLKIGQVTSVDLVYDRETDTITAPVHFEVEPERFLGVGRRISENPQAEVQRLLNRGLRASLQSANLLTGAMLVSLQFVPDSGPTPLTIQDGSIEMPAFDSGGFSGIEAAASELLRKVNTIPFEKIGAQLDGTMAGLDGLANGPQLKQTLTSLAATMSSAHEVLQNLNSGINPVLRRLPAIATNLQTTMTESNKLMMTLQTGYGDDTQFHRDLDRVLAQVTDAVRSIRSLADLLNRHPEALIKGRPAGQE